MIHDMRLSLPVHDFMGSKIHKTWNLNSDMILELCKMCQLLLDQPSGRGLYYIIILPLYVRLNHLQIKTFK